MDDMTEAEERAKKYLARLLERKEAYVNRRMIHILLAFLHSKSLLDEFGEYFYRYLRR